jgi:hypothetical protein
MARGRAFGDPCRGEELENDFLDMEPVFGLVEDVVGMGFEGGFIDFHAAICREAVHDEGTGFGEPDQGGIELEGGELLDAIVGFDFLAHGDPDIGVEDIGVVGGGADIVGAVDPAGTGTGEKGGLRLEGFGGGDAEFETEASSSEEPGAGDVATAIADEGDDAIADGAEFFLDREQIGEDLAGMFLIGEGIDGGDAGVVGEGLDIFLREGSDDGAMDHAPEDAGGVLDGFAPAELDFGGAEEERMAAEFVDTDLEGDACAGGRFGEDESPDLIGQRLAGMRTAERLHGDGSGEDAVDVRGGQGFDAEEMFHGKRWVR